jgi:hypothetical protein
MAADRARLPIAPGRHLGVPLVSADPMLARYDVELIAAA